MKLAPFVVLFAVLAAAACGSEDQRTPPEGAGGTGGAGGDPGPQPPVFAGLDEARFDGSDSALLFWLPASDAETPAEEIRYRIHVWADNPAEEGAGIAVYDWTQTLARCTPRCRFSTNLPPANVTWFAVEAIDGDEQSAGLDVVIPVVGLTTAPSIDNISPSPANVGDIITLNGDAFLDERTAADGLTLGGKPIPLDFVKLGGGWENRRIRFMLPSEFGSGTIGVKTLNGTATVELLVNE